MQRREKKLLFDMLKAATAIEKYLSDITEESFTHDDKVRDAAYFNFMVVGEALTVLNRESPHAAARITDWRKIIGFRNQIVHGYSVLTHETTYQTAKQHLPVLLAELRSLLAE